MLNEAIAEAILEIHDEYPDKGYRRINDDLLRIYGFQVSDNRVLRICILQKTSSTEIFMQMHRMRNG